MACERFPDGDTPTNCAPEVFLNSLRNAASPTEIHAPIPMPPELVPMPPELAGVEFGETESPRII